MAPYYTHEHVFWSESLFFNNSLAVDFEVAGGTPSAIAVLSKITEIYGCQEKSLYSPAEQDWSERY